MELTGKKEERRGEHDLGNWGKRKGPSREKTNGCSGGGLKTGVAKVDLGRKKKEG